MIKTDNRFFKFESVGEFHSTKKWIHPNRIIDSYEIIFALEGIVYIEENGTKYALSPNQVLILEPNKEHKGYKISTEKTAFYWFHFRTDFPLCHKHYTGDDTYEIKQLLKKLLHMANTPSYPTSALDATGLLIFQEFERISSPDFVTVDAMTNKIAEYVRINIRENLSVKAIADHFGYTPDHISRMFKKSFGTGLKNYICRQKLQHSRDRLLTTNLSVKEIAYETGFVSENLFIKFFKYHENISPTAFRNKYFNTHMNKE